MPARDRNVRAGAAFDVPFNQKSTYEPLLNLKTAKELGLTIAPTLLVRVGEVIE